MYTKNDLLTDLHNMGLQHTDSIMVHSDARKLYEVTEKVLSHEINCLIDRKEIPREWWII